MKQRSVWFIRVTNSQGDYGIGEVAPIDRLSPEEIEDVPDELEKLKPKLSVAYQPSDTDHVLSLVQTLVSPDYPSIRFGLEMALLDLQNRGTKKIFRDKLSDVSVPVNGLVWMGNANFMKEQIKEKLDDGFNCIKLKIGSLDFQTELDIIRDLRNISEELIIRLDANGAFQTNEILGKLKILSAFNIHSIEQPILPMQPEALEIVCMKSEIPVALDEELILVVDERDRLELLQAIKPHYLVLKPTLHGGFGSVKEWIDLAEMHGIQWWITSYLESNIGLNAIAQFASLYKNDLHQGLGTGSLFENNIFSPIQVEKGYLKYADSEIWGDVF